jgi:hypothetical protein
MRNEKPPTNQSQGYLRIAPCWSAFPLKYESEVTWSTLPGMNETATLGGSVILQTHG